MCGLTGVAGANISRVIGNPDRLLAKIRHRGPDGEAADVATDWILGHTRLAIQDLSTAAACPYHEGPITLTFNGEIWDHRDLNLGPRDTTGDTEVVAKLLAQAEQPADALNQLDGMFALAWHDARTDMIYLTRDRWGKVPLYYAEDAAAVYWASEYAALPPDLDAHAVPPGVLLEIAPGWGGVMADQQWVDRDQEIPNTLGSSTVRDLLRAGVRQRLIGDRPIAYMLSGGLDSTLILSLALEVLQDVTCYTAVLDPKSPDLIAARRVAKEFGVTLVEVPVPEVTGARIAEAVQVVEIPHKAQVEIALAHLPVMQAVASDGFAVCLSGEAADELFGGYGGMQIKASGASDEEYRAIKHYAVSKMARGNFPRVNKVGMRFGVETRLPFMQHSLVELALAATKEASPPGKTLLKEAAQDLVPEWVIKRRKETFQGAVGTATAAALEGYDVAAYNHIARGLLGHLPKE